jgi:tetratricopeptide (TPR) repeat protein
LAQAERQSSSLFNHIALNGMARSRRLAGQAEAAEELWQRAENILRQELAGSAFGHRRELAQLLLERGHPEDSAEALALLQAEAATRRDVQTLDLLAWAWERSGEFDKALAVSQEAIATGTSRPEILYRASQLATDINPALSIQLLEQVSAINDQFDESTWQALGLMAKP